MSAEQKDRWHVGSRIPINVYEGDRPVCQCHTAIDARRIVDAMNSEDPESESECRLVINAFYRWILVKANNASLAWSGSRWVPVDEAGLPAGDTQIANLESRESALTYAGSFGITVREDS